MNQSGEKTKTEVLHTKKSPKISVKRKLHSVSKGCFFFYFNLNDIGCDFSLSLFLTTTKQKNPVLHEIRIILYYLDANLWLTF